MLVRLLDAFVWRNHGKSHCGPFSIPNAHHFVDRQESSQQLGFTYVQGMNVLAAPFLYTMPSELEAFFCFAKFIEESCPLYVQPTLEGVHRGLRVCITTVNSGLPILRLLRFE
jgi:cell cycle arrest protein BUB2